MAEAAQALSKADASAILVLPRLLRRAIKQDRHLPGLLFRVPHHKSYVIGIERLLQVVTSEELGLGSAAALPARVILIARPEERVLAGMTAPDLLTHCWRMLFHARVHVALEDQIHSGALSLAHIRARIDRIGQTEFDEIGAVIRQENYLFSPASHHELYVEFAAVYLELRFFAPRCLETYFPSVTDFERIDDILADDLDAAKLFHATRLEGARDPQPAEYVETGELPGQLAAPAEAPLRGVHAEKVFWRMIRKARIVSARGNVVRAAIIRMRAARYCRAESAQETMVGAIAELELLTGRLQVALGFDDTEAAAWNAAMAGLLAHSTSGYFNPDARLLYDLQKVCVDYERDTYVVDLAGWLISFGRRPLKRALPNQREVLMSKHLHTAAGRLMSARLSGTERERLSKLLHAAARSAADQLRARLRPLIGQALDDVGLEPRNLPERVSRKKLIEELLDGVVHRGFMTMGNLRDAISRNNLKLEDLSGLVEFWRGDRLLQADRRLGVLLDGVYHRGEFYLRALQGLSSLAFGTKTGRWLTQYVVLPFGGAFVALEGLAHLLNAVTKAMWGRQYDILDGYSLLALGSFVEGLMNVPPFRTFIVTFFKGIYHVLRGVLYELPAWLYGLSIVRSLLRSTPVIMFRRWVLNPLLLTALVWGVLFLPGFQNQLEDWRAVAIFFAFNALLNSRVGRDFEELASEWIEETWHQIRARFFVVLFEVVMGFFKWILEAIERVLYTVDEWLRFKSGETWLTLVAKGILGIAWSVITFVVRIYVNLLIEPQINPIKHFPVVTVSHKIILPFSLVLTRLASAPLQPVLGVFLANALAGSTVFLLPGVFGFLVWELKENWRLYAANRPKQLQPVLVGDHGETMIRLMKPGLHSGTLPKLYGKLRRAERRANSVLPASPWRPAKSKYFEKLHHMEDSVRKFVERELLMLLTESKSWGAVAVSTGEIELASNSLRIELCCPELSATSLWLSFQEQSGWLLAGLMNSGWVVRLSAEQVEALVTALAGFYKIGGVDLVREQIESCFDPQHPPYDVTEAGLVVWPGNQYDVELVYNLEQRPAIKPRPRALAKALNFPTLEAHELIFGESSISWVGWVATWESEQTGAGLPPLFADEIRLLPNTEQLPLVETR